MVKKIGYLLILVLFRLNLYADGFIVIDPMPVILPPVPNPVTTLSVKYHKVTVTIKDQVATTFIDQVFVNDLNVDLEGTYIFPIPEKASITEFVMYVDDKKLTGEILDSTQARQIYENIVRKTLDPALLEYAGRNMFRARVYPIPARGEKRIQITYSEIIEYNSGTYRYVYPLNTEKFSAKPILQVNIDVTVSHNIPIKSVYSPTHNVTINKSTQSVQVSYTATNTKPDKDLILYYTVSENEFSANVLTHHENNGTDGFFLLMAAAKLEPGIVIEKDIVFVIDTSGSMSGDKIKQAKEALKFCINNLNPGDRFNIINFATSINKYNDTLVEVNTTNLNSALGYVDTLNAIGGTDINEALRTGLSLPFTPTRPKMVIFLTDGEPTVGVTDFATIINNVRQSNTSGVKIFVFGVGYDVNTILLDKISGENNGVSEYVHPNENIEVKVSSFYSKVADPMLADTQLKFGALSVYDLYPPKLPDLYRGSQLVLFGRYKSSGTINLELTGRISTQTVTYPFVVVFSSFTQENPFVPVLWATRKIGYLLDQIRLTGTSPELVDEIKFLGKKYGIVTPYTSFLVTEDDLLVAPPPPSANLDLTAGRGPGAVTTAEAVSEFKDSSYSQGSQLVTMKQVNDKTFYLKKGLWTDSIYQESSPTKDIYYLSDEYFQLIQNHPGIAPYLAIGQQLIVTYNTENIRVIIVKTAPVVTDIDNTVELYDSTKLIISKNVLPESTTVTISIPALSSVPPVVLADTTIKPTNIVREIKLSNNFNLFNGTVTISIPYTDTEIQGVREDSLTLYYYSDTNKVWEKIVNSTVYPTENKINAYINHFTLFQVMGTVSSPPPPPPPPEEVNAKFKVYPNPFIPSRGNNKIVFTGVNDNTTIEIYDAGGMRVRKLTHKTEGIWSWDGKNETGTSVGSGIYFYYITDTKEKGTLAIIR